MFSKYGPSDYIQEKTSQTVMETGRTEYGVIASMFPGLKSELVDSPGTIIVLSCEDVKERTYSTKYLVPEEADVFVTNESGGK